MKKEDIEKILDLSYKLGRSKFGKDVSLIDMYDLACKVWAEIEHEPIEPDNTYIILNKYQLEKFEQHGEFYITMDDDHEITLLYAPHAYQLESGKILDHWDLNKNEEHELDFFFNKSVEIRKPIEKSLLSYEAPCSDIINWIVNHIKSIENVVGFDIKNVDVKKEVDNVVIDVYGEDNNGNPIVIDGDGESTSNLTLCELLIKSILIDAKKVIWVANRVEDHHAMIIKWLNEYYSKRISFYLIEAKYLTVGKEHNLATTFRLVESPVTGWRDWV